MKGIRISLLLTAALLAACGEKEPVDSAADADGDGFTEDVDCDDGDAGAYPDAPELCDDVDNDCDGLIDEDPTDGATYYTDVDGDGYGDPAASRLACEAGGGLVDNDLDCDDSSAGVNPEAQEYCDGVDNDCDAETDEPDALGTSTFYADDDADGYGDPDATTAACAPPEGYTSDHSDCDDDNADINPDADEVCDSVDNDCDGDTDEDSAVDAAAWYRDLDGDGYGNPELSRAACEMPSGYVADNTDCYDNNADINPGVAETWYDGTDSSCHGGSDYDADQDGHDSMSWRGDDCDDAEPNAFPGNAEVWYDGVDGDCDGGSDYDADADGEDAEDYGGTDCDDADAAIYSGATEIWYDGTDSDCDGWNDFDADYDWHLASSQGGDDCDDADATVHPYAWEDVTDGVDNDCDGTADVNNAVALSHGDDDYDVITLSSWTFDICGGSYADVTISSNGKVLFEDIDGVDWDDFSETTAEFLEDAVQIAARWDDFYPPGGDDVYYLETTDALVVYWQEIPPCCSTGSGNTFSVVLHRDGWFQLNQGASDQSDGLVGFSCATDASAPAVDLSAALWDLTENSLGLGQGTEAAYYEYFSSGFDLADTSLRFCGWSGTDGDADGWTDDCGDPDDTDASITP